MAILIYDYCELEERASRHLRAWKAWHIVIFALTAIFGILNYVFLRNTMSMVGENCVLVAPKIELKTVWINLPNSDHQITNTTGKTNETEPVMSEAQTVSEVPGAHKTSIDEHRTTNITGKTNETEAVISKAQIASEVPDGNETLNREQRNANTTGKGNETEAQPASEGPGVNKAPDGEHQTTNTTRKSNETEVVTGEAQPAKDVLGANKTMEILKGEADIANSTNSGEEHEVLDLKHSYFGSFRDCEYAEFAPLGAAMCALLWLVLFLMCPGGGRPRSGLTEPWRILAPALLCSLVLVGITGHGFTQTNRGLREFCAAFQNVTNATTCSSVNVYLESSWNTSWAFSSRVEATRAASAALWVCWAGVATLLIVRCLAAPDFQLRRTGVYLARDPAQKVTPYLRKASGRAGATPSPDKSARSNPTATTELVTASADDSSVTNSPIPEHVSSV